MRKQRNLTPYFTTAKFDSVCAETGKQIKRGETIAYYPQDKKAYCEDSNQATELRSYLFDLNCLGANY